MTPQEKEIAFYGICFMIFCFLASFGYTTYSLITEVKKTLNKK